MEEKIKILIRSTLKKKKPLKVSLEDLKMWLEEEELPSFRILFLQQMKENSTLPLSFFSSFLKGSWEERMLCAQGVRYFVEDSQDFLEILLQDEEVAVQIAAIESILSKEYRHFFEDLLLLEGIHPDLDKALAEMALLESSDRLRQLLERYLHSSHYEISSTAMKYLRTQGTSPLIRQRLLELLRDPNWSLRRLAALTLGELQDLEGIRQMMYALDQEQESVLEAMGKSFLPDDETCLEILLEQSTIPLFRAGAAFLFGYAQDKRSEERLLELLQDPEDLVRRYSRRSLAQRTYEKDWDIYKQGLKETDWKSRLDLVKHLGKLQGSEKLQLIQRALEDTYWAIGRESFLQLQQLTSEEANLLLSQCLNHPDPWIRQHTCEEIGKRKLVQCKKNLERALQDSDYLIRKEALRALNSI